MIKVDFQNIKKKLLKRTFGEWRETLEALDGEENVITDEIKAVVEKCVAKQIKRDVKDINRTFKLINRKRKKLNKAGTIDEEVEFYAFINQLGINTGDYFDNPDETEASADAEPEETAEATETDEETAQEGAEEPKEEPERTDEREQTG